jgi:methylmalonyl-CoA mutase
MAKAVATGMPKLRIDEAAAKNQARIDSKQDIIVGVNKYVLEEEDPYDVLKIENNVVRNEQDEILDHIKATRNEDGVCRLLDLIESAARRGQTSEGSRMGNDNVLTIAIECAKARCTVGEISVALENGFGGRYMPTSRVVSGAYKAAFTDEDDFQKVVERCTQFENDYGRRPRILVAKIGQDGHDRGAKVIASGFADLGFDVDIGPLFSTPEEVVKQALDADVHILGSVRRPPGITRLCRK